MRNFFTYFSCFVNSIKYLYVLLTNFQEDVVVKVEVFPGFGHFEP